MSPNELNEQLRSVIGRLILANLSVKQRQPLVNEQHGGSVSIGAVRGTTVALKNIPYEDIYQELDANEAFHVKLVDGGLLLFQYLFDKNQILKKHRLCFFPNPNLPTLEEAPGLYENDELYGDITSQRNVRFPIRFDFDPSASIDVEHPVSHLSLGQYENCRVPVEGPVGPNAFVVFIVRNFYTRAYRHHKNSFDKKPTRLGRASTITSAERRTTYLVNGR